MRARSQETVEHRTCPEHVVEQLRIAGGINPFGDPQFRIVWGYDRIVKLHGEWQEFEQCMATLTDRLTGYTEQRLVTRLARSVVETREIPKYLPANCWHLEKWCSAETYGSPEQWREAGLEKLGTMTVDTSGPYPERGEYELCYPLTDDGTSNGQALPLVSDVVTELVRMIVKSRELFSLQQRRAAIEQEAKRKEDGFVRITQDRLKDGLRPFLGETYIVKP